MTTSGPLRLYALKQATPGHTGTGLWRSPLDESFRYADLGYLTSLARMLEQGGFDGVFFADAIGQLDVYEGRPDAALRDGIGSPGNDPVPAIAAMAAVTTTLDFAVTMSTSYHQPYALARTMGTLDHLTGGRIGWNIVTSTLESGARNMGLGALPDHDERYDIAEEFLDVVYALLEGSWEDDAVVRDVARGMYTDPARVHPVGHHGDHFSVPGIGPVEPSPQRTPVLFQAGSSGRGLAFAGTHAEGVFLSAMTPQVAAAQVAKLTSAVDAAGRSRQDVVVLANATAIVAPTDAEAQALYRDAYLAHVSATGSLARYSALLGTDLSTFAPDEPIRVAESGGIRGLVDAFTKLHGGEWTPRRLGAFVAIGGGGPVIVGSPTTVADELVRWRDASGVDGFNLADPLPGHTLRAVCELLTPELRSRGLMAPHPGATFRDRLHGRGDRLRAPHPAAAVRERYRAPR